MMGYRFPCSFLCIALGLLSLLASSVLAELHPHTLVLYNRDFPESQALAQHYAQARKLTPDQLIELATSDKETISQAEYFESILRPLQAVLKARPQTKTIVLVHGIPLRIKESNTQLPQHAYLQQSASSVDSELAALPLLSSLPESQPRYRGAITNPLFRKSSAAISTQNASPTRAIERAGQPRDGQLGIKLPVGQANREASRLSTARSASPYMIGRLDGPNAKSVRALIDRTLLAERQGLRGLAYTDLAYKGGGYVLGDHWLQRSEQLLWQHGMPVIRDPHKTTYPHHYPMLDACVYLGWYTWHTDGPFLHPNFRFNPGAIAVHLHSFSAASVRSPDQHWIGPLIAKGACASLGTVWEPTLGLVTHYDRFIEGLLAGKPLGLAAWSATPTVSWQNIVLGDPHYRPFAKKAHARQALSPQQALSELLRAHPPHTKQALVSDHALSELQTSKEPWSLELLGHLHAQRQEHALAADHFQRASDAYPARSPERLRSATHWISMQRLQKQSHRTLALLQALQKEYRGSSWEAATENLLQQLYPPAPELP